MISLLMLTDATAIRVSECVHVSFPSFRVTNIYSHCKNKYTTQNMLRKIKKSNILSRVWVCS
jgi:hypothetical protein